MATGDTEFQLGIMAGGAGFAASSIYSFSQLFPQVAPMMADTSLTILAAGSLMSGLGYIAMRVFDKF